MSRFANINKRINLKFDYNLYDTVRLDDNRTAIITDFGIYDNQYWCEVCYPNGVELGSADYFSCNTKFSPYIINKIEGDERKSIINKYLIALVEFNNRFDVDENFTNEINRVKQVNNSIVDGNKKC